jgi:predicted amidohydrolase YtcJ
MTADFILYDANVVTLDSNYPEAQLVAVRNGKVLAVANNEALAEFRGPGTTIIDCQGKRVLPGSNDAHCHLVALAKSLISLNVGPAKVRSILDIQKEIRKLAQNLPQGSWISADGYNEFYLAEKRHPTRWDLDKASSVHPVKLTHRSGHAHVLNSLALALVGISKETPDPPGGIIERELQTGEPNGLLYDMGDFLSKRVPPLSDSELERGIKLANQELLSLGITSIQDASPENDFQRWEMFHRWKTEGSLKCRLSLMLGTEGFNRCQEEGLPPDLSGSGIHFGGVKIVLQETTGQLSPSWEELEQIVPRIHQSNLQVALHAVEETTVEAACSILERTLQKSPRPDHRHRIEHCSVCRPEIAKRLASLGAMVVTQPAFIYYNGDRYLKTVPESQLKHLYPLATFLKAGVKVAAGSDCPVVPPNPLIGIYAAISRRAETGETISPRECVSPLEALRMYTVNAAYASFEEAVKGSITPGKFADLVVLSDGPMKVPIEEVKDLQVETTIIGGGVVWGKV